MIILSWIGLIIAVFSTVLQIILIVLYFLTKNVKAIMLSIIGTFIGLLYIYLLYQMVFVLI